MEILKMSYRAAIVLRQNILLLAITVSLGLVGSIAGNTIASLGDVIDVSSVSELNSALDSATGGETIRLAGGAYGALALHDRSYTDYVTITSADAKASVRFINIDFERASYIRLDGLTIIPGAREGVGIFSASHHIEVLNSEIFGANQFDRSNPDYTQVSTLYGINTGGDVHNILIKNNNVHDVKSSAYLFVSIKDSVIAGNQCDWVASDCFKFASAEQILFENNFGAQHIYSSPSAHVDFVQGQGVVKDSIFRGNVAIMGTRSFQGLFFDDATFTNLTFENNVIYTANIRGISVSGAESTGIVARYNTVLIAAGSQKASLIILPSGSEKEHNIEGNNVAKNTDRLVGTNIVAQWDDPDDIAHYSQYYGNATRGPGASISDFRPVKGSAADGLAGAFARIYQLLQPGFGENKKRNLQVIPLKKGGLVVLPM